MHPAAPLCGEPICHPKVPIVFLTGNADTTAPPPRLAIWTPGTVLAAQGNNYLLM
jgi:hypothetical protein